MGSIILYNTSPAANNINWPLSSIIRTNKRCRRWQQALILQPDLKTWNVGIFERDVAQDMWPINYLCSQFSNFAIQTKYMIILDKIYWSLTPFYMHQLVKIYTLRERDFVISWEVRWRINYTQVLCLVVNTTLKLFKLFNGTLLEKRKMSRKPYAWSKI